ncbi:MAG: saccharopine dehydrogenase family protein [Candidatus Njordarchaeia archaeon]
MSVAVFGAGNIGRVVALYLVESDKVDDVAVFDVDNRKLEQLSREASSDKLSVIQTDVLKDSKVTNMMCDFDVISSLLPGSIGDAAYELSIGCKTNLVDTSYTETDPFTFDRRAKDAKVVIIPDAGVAPGLSNLLVGHAVSKLDVVEKVAIYVGGLPQKPRKPFYHEVNWSVSDLLEEYSRKVRLVRDGKIHIVEPLSGREEFYFKGFRLLEAFYTDGLRTLLKTIKAKNMFEKTLRHRGHLDLILQLYEFGFFSKETIQVDNCLIRPIDFTSKIFQKSIFNPDMRDVLVMHIDVVGTKNEERTKITFRVIDYYDESKKMSAMARTTGFTNAALVELLLSRQLNPGVLPPEIIGMNDVYYQFILDRLKAKDVKVEETVVKGD